MYEEYEEDFLEESEEEEYDPNWEDDRDNDYAERYRDFMLF